MNWHFANNYYHFVIELLPKCILYNTQITYPISCKKQFFISEYFDLFGLDEKKYLRFKDSEKLPATFFKVPTSKELAIFNSLKTIAKAKNYPSRIYISRSKAKRRKLINEDQLLKEIKIYDFEILYLEEMPVIEQIKYFFNADIIIGVHGAGLTNIVYCNPQTTIIELKRNEKVNPVDSSFVDFNNCFKHISQVLNLIYKEIYLPTKDEGSAMAHRPLIYLENKIDINISSFPSRTGKFISNATR